MADRRTRDLVLLPLALLACNFLFLSATIAGCSLEFKAVALSQNGDGHSGIPQQISTLPFNPTIYHASSMRVGVQMQKVN